MRILERVEAGPRWVRVLVAPPLVLAVGLGWIFLAGAAWAVIRLLLQAVGITTLGQALGLQ